MFKNLKTTLQEHFNTNINNNDTVFYATIDREKIWECYISGFTDPVEYQSHNCNCCKSFLRQFGGMVAIKNNKVVSLWDISEDDIDDLYKPSVKNLKEYIHSLPITNIFKNEFSKLGTDKNFDPKTMNTWEHFFVQLHSKHSISASAKDTVIAQLSSQKDVFKRGLQELTFEALDTVLELINQNSLYRGKEWESRIASFRNLKTRFEASENKDNFCWENLKDAQGAATLRNTSMGTLLVELSAGEELDKAVRSFERMVAPSNYQRPTALVTKSMVEAAKKKILELGYEESLARRHAVMEDLNIQNLLFVDRSSDILSSDVFSELAKSAPVNPKSFSKLEEISIEDFIEKVLPKTKSLKVFTENEHISNFVSLIAPDNKNAKSLFKWANGFSWSYTGGITDSIKQRVKSAGGNVDGIIRVSLSWYNYDDLDLHVFEPQGNHIYYGSKHNHATTGVLDVDMNAGGGHTRNAVENITWSKMSSMQSGVYKVQVKNYNRRESFDTGFEVEIEHNGVVYRASSKNSPSDSSTVDVFTFRYNNKSDTFEILTSLSKDEGKVVSKDVWNVKTNVFTKVKSVMLSPNHWEKNSGNKHYFFILDSCVSPENPRGFFNEFLNDELSKDKKVFEALGNKLTVPNSDKQVSGLGFSETQRNSLVVEVDGTFKRQLKIKF